MGNLDKIKFSNKILNIPMEKGLVKAILSKLFIALANRNVGDALRV